MNLENGHRKPMVYSGVNVETVPCPECGVPFMLSVVQAEPLHAGLAIPGPTVGSDDGMMAVNGQGTRIRVKPVRAWRICLNCLWREVTQPKPNGTGWEVVQARGNNRAERREERKRNA